MKKVLKFVKGKKEERRECGGVTPSQSGELISPAQTPEEEGISGVDNGYNVDFCGKDKTLTKLHKAAWQGNLDKLKSALKKVDVDAVDRRGRTALHFAVAQGHPNIVWFLLGNNASTSICDDKGHSPLLKAVECAHKECMTLLLDRGANVNAADYTGNTALHMAIGRGSFDTASSLLKYAADPDVSNNAGDYPLHTATRLESKDLVDLLLGAGASVDVLDRENRTPLMLAAKTGNRVLAQVFLQRGAQLKVVDSNGWTAQDYALLGGHEDVASWLSSHGKSQLPGGGQIEKEPASQKVGGTSEQEDSAESPDVEAIPPYCQPPRSWEMIQAGMIDEKKDGSEPKRRSITTLGTLHSRRDSFTEPPVSSPKSTLSLNRRRPNKEHNAFAKNRFSLSEEANWSEKANDPSKDPVAVGSDWDSSEDSTWTRDSESGTLGRQGTMLGVEELWVANPHVTPQGEDPLASWHSQKGSPPSEKTFPPPPTGLELGVDMARSIRCLKGLSVDQSPGRSGDRNLWRNPCDRHSLDCLDGRPHTEQLFKYQNPTDKLGDVSRRISEQLECYDQALRELAESSKPDHNYYSLPSKGGGRNEWRQTSCRGEVEEEAGSRSLPIGGMERRAEGEGGRVERKKKHMLLAMREVKHANESMEEQLLSPKEEKSSPKETSSGSGGNSPAEENPFFGVGRQETVLERTDGGRDSEGSETAEESTLWLQDEGEKRENSDEEVAEIGAEEGTKHGGPGSFSPLGVIQREMEEESRGQRRRGVQDAEEPASGENEEVVIGEPSPDVSLSSGPIEPLGADKDSGSEPESSHNDASPPHNYALKSQHEWLKSHLRAATSEKNKLEELTAQLTEKAERLQYELADAKEAGKSRDEVIQLLQGQLARMEAAYTKSLEESVQSRLQLTSHEQEILHLKELCYRYQEEKEAAGSGQDCLQDLQLKIKILEEEKEKMKGEISQLEEEKSLLEGQLRQRMERQGDREVVDQCQRWKERCKELEEMIEGYVSKELSMKENERERQQKHQSEKKLAEALEENDRLRAAVEREKRRARGTEQEKEELLAELERRKAEAKSELRRVEEAVEEQWVRKLKEKEEEMRGMMEQLERRKGPDASWKDEDWKRESERLRQMVQCLEERVRGVQEGGAAARENARLKQDVEELRAELGRERREEGAGKEKKSAGTQKGEGVNEGCKMREEGVRKRGFLECLSEVRARGEGGPEAGGTVQDLEYLELKKQILSLESKMSNEKNLRHSLENEMIKMRVSLNEKEKLELEVDSLKRKVGMQWLGKSGMELLEYERDLQAKREKYLSRGDGAVDQSTDYKAKCQLLAREKERFKQLTKSTAKTLSCPPPSPSPPPILHPHSRPQPQILLHPPQLLLHPQLRHSLDYQLERSIHRYTQGSASTLSVLDTQF